MNSWSEDSNYQYNNIVDINIERKNQFVSDVSKNYVDETYINKKKNVTVRKWRIKIV